MDLTNQDNIVKRIVDVFSIARVIDRRGRPTHGYRAVHVIVTLDNHLLEIQVRTLLQDLWAQAMERLADEVGRDIRYGGVPQKRGADVKNLLNISDEISVIESVLTRLNKLQAGLPQPRRLASMQREWRLHIANIQSFRADLRGREKEIRAMLG